MTASNSIRDRLGARVVALVAALALVLGLAWIALIPDGRGGGSPAGAASGKPPAAASTTAPVPAAILARRAARKRYWGAWIGSQLTGEQAPFDMRAVSKFERIADKPLSIVHWAYPFADCTSNPCTFIAFPSREVTKVRRHGAIPMVSWSSAAVPDAPDQRAFQLRDIAAGRYDGYIRSFARAALAWGNPFFLRFNWEMNGDWFPWGVRANRNRARDYVSAWRHVHRIFDRVGARNATWVWCPYVDPDHRFNLKRLYPGGAFVDWTCLDAYNWGRNPVNSTPWRSFGELVRSTYRRIARGFAPHKPMMLGEIASSDYGGSKARWIRHMLRTIPRHYSKIRAVVYYDVEDRNVGWPIETPRRVRRAFRSGINQRSYVPNRFRRLHARPIPPPPRR